MQDNRMDRRLKGLMTERRMSARTLAALSGISYGKLLRVLRGRRPLYTEELRPLAGALGVSVDTLLDLRYTGEKQDWEEA